MISESNVAVRLDTSADRAVVHAIHAAAFGRPDEADLVENLRAEGVVLESLVAQVEDGRSGAQRIVGHILFSRMGIDTDAGSIPAVALAPVAVLPEYQCRGIGGRLIREGLDLLRHRGERIVIVLGEPDYYSRFGFSCEKAQTLRSPFPPEAYMALELTATALDGLRGSVKYPVAFGL